MQLLPNLEEEKRQEMLQRSAAARAMAEKIKKSREKKAEAANEKAKVMTDALVNAVAPQSMAAKSTAAQPTPVSVRMTAGVVKAQCTLLCC